VWEGLVGIEHRQGLSVTVVLQWCYSGVTVVRGDVCGIEHRPGLRDQHFNNIVKAV
jgi:hypothetical protein